MSPLCSDDRHKLLRLARWAIEKAVCHGHVPEPAAPTGALADPGGAFVTLERRGRLRGCIGQMQASESLASVVARCAVAAALADPRFHPVQPDEVPELEIELSLLSRPEPVRPEAVEVGRHGLAVARGERRGVLLPQVATEYHWTRERFLEETCLKAGLEPDAWKDPGTQILAFTAEVFSEADFPGERSVQANDSSQSS